MTSSRPIDEAPETRDTALDAALDRAQPGAHALRSAETALTRIQRYAEAVQSDTLTPGEAIEQILDELAARPALGRVRQALSRSFSPAQPN
jgi:cell division protein YceG involved in septum cleavage